MSVGVAEDAGGAERVLIGTSEPRGYIRPGVTINEGETVVSGSGHAEENVINYARDNGMTLRYIGATRPMCFACMSAVERSGAIPLTPLK